MARCYQLSPAQSQQWDEGSWPSIQLEDTIFEWAYRLNIREPIIGSCPSSLRLIPTT